MLGAMERGVLPSFQRAVNFLRSSPELVKKTCRHIASVPDVLLDLRPGDSFSPELVGRRTMGKCGRNLLVHSGLHYCRIMKKLYNAQDMYGRYTSYEGLQRRNLCANAKARAERKCLPFDSNMMTRVAFSQLPSEFNGEAYLDFGRRGHRPHPQSLSIDRI